MESNVTVSVNEKGHAVITHALPLVDYCVKRAQTLRAMVEVVSSGQGHADGANPVSPALVKPLMELIRTHAEELAPLFRALDQRAYEKGFDDGRDVSFPRKKAPALSNDASPSA
ncbi:hypothetical protein P9239_21625 [Caballeronia sp. LZ062]|uniref:hypothetical protein n=1 Tax=unclassified Caballeronia TaxID=2646786 RepID=UPI00286536BE|nr:MULTISPECIES: hypothetical protein [unclassified Caballeronia]MDR5856280.1 hypothetical protein [Caballeronia sp. LZ050]MDR5872951.1 hypothetical protein [Caballeronia sp. LZ062]